jgi:hypothetical protein
MDQVLMYTANYGFPMVVTAYLLVRIEGRLGALDKSIQELTRAIQK